MLGSHSQPTHLFISATVGYTTASPCTRQQLSAYPSFYLCHSWLHHSQSLHQTATISLPILLSLPQLVTPQPVPAPDSNYQPTHFFISATVGYTTASPSTRQQLSAYPSLHLCHRWLHHSQSLHQVATISLSISATDGYTTASPCTSKQPPHNHYFMHHRKTNNI